ncbi:SecDF P1 head subdomain-containing protein [Actinokineospora cianjurensis]|uniref:SecDF P1 head subdomain domain-containing protein n=1 Tax=Actinokineospora cianjurensis TaxID=585224 RepID=A0A421B595_9PSEU|nr:hypothetical protein [Actinokineospora cianjurensis]RLK59418.1 hypothetical protein CLV68_3905 [Actinokineospora cianjurensis]
MRKPILALLLAAVLPLAACGSDATPAAPPSTAASAAGGGLLAARVPVELRPVTSVKPGLEVSGPDEVIGPDESVYTLGPSIGEFTEFKDVRPEKTDYGWVITIDLPSATSAVFAKWTTEHVDEQLAVMVDGKLVSAPKIASPITGGALQISGNFTEASAKQLVTDITGETP